MTPTTTELIGELCRVVVLKELRHAVRDVWRAKLDDMPDFVRLEASRRYLKARDQASGLSPEEIRDEIDRGVWLAYTGGRR